MKYKKTLIILILWSLAIYLTTAYIEATWNIIAIPQTVRYIVGVLWFAGAVIIHLIGLIVENTGGEQ